MVRKSQDRNARLTLCEASVCKMEQRTNDMEVNATENSLMVQKEQQQLKDVIRASIQQLVQYIFPIEPVSPIPRLDDTSVSDFPIIFDAVCTQVGSYMCVHNLVSHHTSADGSKVRTCLLYSQYSWYLGYQ